MFHLFGYRLIPRIRNLGDRRLFVIDPESIYDPLDVLIGGTAGMGKIEPHWDEVLRLADRLTPEHVRASTVSSSCRTSNAKLRSIGYATDLTSRAAARSVARSRA